MQSLTPLQQQRVWTNTQISECGDTSSFMLSRGNLKNTWREQWSLIHIINASCAVFIRLEQTGWSLIGQAALWEWRCFPRLLDTWQVICNILLHDPRDIYLIQMQHWYTNHWLISVLHLATLTQTHFETLHSLQRRSRCSNSWRREMSLLFKKTVIICCPWKRIFSNIEY